MRAFSVTVAEADEDEAVAALWEAGTAGIEVKPARGGCLRLLAYFAEGAPAPSLHVLPPGAIVEPAEVPDVDWVARFREGFHAFRAGRFLVTPPWDLPPSSAGAVSTPVESSTTAEPSPRATDPSSPEPSPDRHQACAETLIVDPGRAFGTGTHETTRLCLSALEGLAARRRLGRALDLGAGTGLLAIAARCLGASPVVASDIDPEATRSSRHHASLNQARLHVVQADGGRPFRPGAFDLVLANLMALLLVERADEIRALVAPGGALVLSGLLVEDVPFVREAFERSDLLLEPPLGGGESGRRIPAGRADPRAALGIRPGPPSVRCGEPSVVAQGEWAALVYEEGR